MTQVQYQITEYTVDRKLFTFYTEKQLLNVFKNP